MQTLTIGGGHILGIRVEERQRRYRKALADLAAALEENAGLHAQLMTQAREAGVLDERQRMAREIHDTLAQGLTGIIPQLRRPVRATLTDREMQVLTLVADGASNRQAAAKLFISEASIKTHLLHIYDKLDVRYRAAAVGEAYRRGLLS
ncbi:LuxR C-terminal-related transcriptional regulator [Streptosporangium roseum]|uniref:helix-turn-helix domain-containing protein n=1 Tax=Streptosporangium roseum TaxID=2001 RepID=UPI0001A3D7FB